MIKYLFFLILFLFCFSIPSNSQTYSKEYFKPFKDEVKFINSINFLSNSNKSRFNLLSEIHYISKKNFYLAFGFNTDLVNNRIRKYQSNDFYSGVISLNIGFNIVKPMNYSHTRTNIQSCFSFQRNEIVYNNLSNSEYGDFKFINNNTNSYFFPSDSNFQIQTANQQSKLVLNQNLISVGFLVNIRNANERYFEKNSFNTGGIFGKVTQENLLFLINYNVQSNISAYPNFSDRYDLIHDFKGILKGRLGLTCKFNISNEILSCSLGYQYNRRIILKPHFFSISLGFVLK